MKEVANVAVRVLMTKRGMRQKDLAEVLGKTQPEISYMLRTEMGKDQQRKIMQAINEWNVKNEKEV